MVDFIFYFIVSGVLYEISSRTMTRDEGASQQLSRREEPEGMAKQGHGWRSFRARL